MAAKKGGQATPNEVYLGVHIQREDMAIPHEEANVINVNQVISAAKQGHKTIQVICDDTHVIVLLAHFYQSSTCYLYIVPTSTSENVINISLTVQQHSEIVPHLISMHTFTGCDSVSSIFGIGKVKTLNTLKKGHKPQSDIIIIIIYLSIIWRQLVQIIFSANSQCIALSLTWSMEVQD